MIQFNLLPDVKIEHVKSQRMKRLVIIVTIVITSVLVGILTLLFSYSFTQNRHITNLNDDIKAATEELESNQDLTRILTVQNQLKSLPALYDGRPAAERLPGFIDQTTPADVGIGSLEVDFSTSTIVMSGTATNIQSVNSHVDTLKFTLFRSEPGAEPVNAFSNVVLTEFGRSEEGASFTINFNFDPQLFDATKNIELTVPNIITTRSEVRAKDLFNGSVPADGEEVTEEAPVDAE